MLLKFCGAAKEVTGSNYLLEVAGKRVLVDCGMHQGDHEEANYEPFPYAANSIDAVLLTHAHIDHSGRIPKLVREGFRGKIYATLPTIELTEILWDDSVRLMREDAEWQTSKNERRGLPAVEPLYGQEDADAAKKLFEPVNYDQRLDIFDGISVRFRDAGHILGSSIIEMLLTEANKVVRIVFSGDLGPMQTVMERAPAEITDADYVVIESTYGNREHKDNLTTRNEFQTMMKEIFATKKAKVFIPAHAAVTDSIAELAQVNIDQVNEIADRILALCETPCSFEELLRQLFDAYALAMNFEQYVLVGSTVRSYLAWLKDTGRLDVSFEENRMLWSRKQ